MSHLYLPPSGTPQVKYKQIYDGEFSALLLPISPCVDIPCLSQFKSRGFVDTMHLSAFLSSTLLTALVAGHPGHDHTAELNARLDFLANNKNNLSHCAEQLRARGLDAINAKRRTELAESLLKKRGLEGKLRNVTGLQHARYLLILRY